MADGVAFYCPQVLGIGHLVCSAEIVSELSRDSQVLVKWSSFHPELGALDTGASSSAGQCANRIKDLHRYAFGQVDASQRIRESGIFPAPSCHDDNAGGCVSPRWGAM